MSLFKKQEAHAFQPVRIGHGFAGFGLGAHENKGFVKERHFVQRRLGHRQCQNGRIEFAVGQFTQERGRQGFADVDFGVREAFGKSGQDFRQQIGRILFGLQLGAIVSQKILFSRVMSFRLLRSLVGC